MIKDAAIDWTYFNNKPGIYKITNIANGKLYIGATSGFGGRFSTHKRELKNGTEHNPHLRNAYKKYGFDKFIYTPILACEKSELERYEIALIKLYKTQDRKIGYNVTPGGKRIFGKDHPMFGKKLPPEWAKKCGNKGEKNYWYGKRPEAFIRASVLVNRIPVIQMDKRGNFIAEYSSIVEATKAVGGKHRGNINRVCKGFQNIGKYIVNRKTAYGYMWQYKKNNAGIPVGG